MRLLPILLLAACLQEPNVSQEASDASQGYVLRYNAGAMCVVKGISSVACLPTDVTARGSKIYYNFVKKLPITIGKDQESSLLSFELAKLYFSFTDGQQQFRNCLTWDDRPWLRNMPFTINEKYSHDDVTCREAIDMQEVEKEKEKEKEKFSNICPLDNTKLQHKYEGGHYYLYEDSKCKLRLYVGSDAITYLQDKERTHLELMQCSANNDSLMKFKLSDGDQFTIACTDEGIKFMQGQNEVTAQMAKGKTYDPYDNEYDLEIFWDVSDSGLKVVAKLPKSSGLANWRWTSPGRETRIIIYNEQGQPKPIERNVFHW